MISPLSDLFGNKGPQTDTEWNQLDFRAADIFSPHSPIDEEQLFVGRLALVDGLFETVFQRGQHAILYGERGVGKTSLANIIGTKVFERSKRYTFVKRNCTEAHDFKLIWEHLFDKFQLSDGSTLGQGRTYIMTRMLMIYIIV